MIGLEGIYSVTILCILYVISAGQRSTDRESGIPFNHDVIKNNFKIERRYDIFKAHSSDEKHSISDTEYFSYEIIEPYQFYERVMATGHVTTVRNPRHTFSILEPGNIGGCAKNKRATVEKSAKQRDCLVAQNGGFFDIETDACLGNLVSDGRRIQIFPNLRSVNFGITKNGSVVTGYLTASEIMDLDFQQLIGGVIWLVRQGVPYVEMSLEEEGCDIQTTGSLRLFADVRSGRSALGHDALGRVVLVNVEGKTGLKGIDLNQLARILVEKFNVVSAINLDGGGSVTTILNGTIVSYVADRCPNDPDPDNRCPRKLSTILCVHDFS